MNKIPAKVAVCSRSFSQNPVLRSELLARYSDAKFNDEGAKLEGDDLVAFLSGVDKAIVALEIMDEYVLARLPELKVIGKYGVGLDRIDLDAMRMRGVRLGWTSGVNKRSVAELALASMIVMLRHVPRANREVLDGTWRQHVGGQLSGRTVGIVGCGHVGKDMVRLLQPFNCTLLSHDIADYQDFYAEFGVEPVDLDTLLSRSDVVSLHLPLDRATAGIITEERLAMLRPHAVFINTARGGLVDEAALKQALRSGRLAAAAFDVFGHEPPDDVELLQLPNFLATPHLGGSAEEAILAMGRAAIEGLDKNRIP